MFQGLDPFATPTPQYSNGTLNPPVPA